MIQVKVPPKPTIMPPEVHVRVGTQEGDNWVPEGQHDTHQAPEGRPNPGGTGGTHDELRPIPDHLSVRASEIVARFKTRTPSMAVSTQHAYALGFARFAKAVRLERLRLRDLRNPKSLREVLLGYIASERSAKMSGQTIRTRLSGIQRVLQEGADVDVWPLRRSDLPRRTPPDGGFSPPDATMRAWGEAILKEPDVHTKLVLVLLGDYGWRPEDQLGELKKSDVLRDSDGKPIAVVSRGWTNEATKTGSPIWAHLWSDAVDAIQAFWKRYPVGEDDPLVPWVSSVLKKDRINQKRGLTRQCVSTVLNAFADKHNLPKMTARLFRKFVKKKCREAGMSYPARAALCGHKSEAPGVEGRYDRPELDDVLAEQAQKMDRGPLGMVVAPRLETIPEGDREILDLFRRLREGKMAPSEFTDKALALSRTESLKGVYVR